MAIWTVVAKRSGDTALARSCDLGIRQRGKVFAGKSKAVSPLRFATAVHIQTPPADLGAAVLCGFGFLPVRFATVILAAGASTRMGKPKLLLPWGKKTILAHLVQQWTDLGAAQIGLVVEQGSAVAVEAERLKAERPSANVEHATSNIQRSTRGTSVQLIINPNPALGMWSSILCAARWQGWTNDLTHFVITLGDQPHVAVRTLQAIIKFAEHDPECICQPARKGRGRHPVVLPSTLFADLTAAKESNLKDFLHSRESQREMFDSDDPALDLDIDTPTDYANALHSSNP